MKLIALTLLLMAPGFSWAENYICVPDQATGFSTETGKYEITKLESKRIIISTEDKTLSLFGEGIFNNECYVNQFQVMCEETFLDFKMSRDLLRFIAYHKSYGYVVGAGFDTPHIAIGTCSEF